MLGARGAPGGDEGPCACPSPWPHLTPGGSQLSLTLSRPGDPLSPFPTPLLQGPPSCGALPFPPTPPFPDPARHPRPPQLPPGGLYNFGGRMPSPPQPAVPGAGGARGLQARSPPDGAGARCLAPGGGGPGPVAGGRGLLKELLRFPRRASTQPRALPAPPPPSLLPPLPFFLLLLLPSFPGAAAFCCFPGFFILFLFFFWLFFALPSLLAGARCRQQGAEAGMGWPGAPSPPGRPAAHPRPGRGHPGALPRRQPRLLP